MPTEKKGQSVAGVDGQDRPVLFQRYFKNGNKTYAAQIKLAASGRRYLVITEGTRDPDTQALRKQIVRVHEQDLKSFFSMLQEVVVYLRAHRNPQTSYPEAARGSVIEASPRPQPAARPAPAKSTGSSTRASRASSTAGAAKPVRKSAAPKTSKPPVQTGKSTKGSTRTSSRTR